MTLNVELELQKVIAPYVIKHGEPTVFGEGSSIYFSFTLDKRLQEREYKEHLRIKYFPYALYFQAALGNLKHLSISRETLDIYIEMWDEVQEIQKELIKLDKEELIVMASQPNVNIDFHLNKVVVIIRPRQTSEYICLIR